MRRNSKRNNSITTSIEQSNSSSVAPAHNGCSMIAASIVEKNSCTLLLSFSGFADENWNDTMKLKHIYFSSLKLITSRALTNNKFLTKNINCRQLFLKIEKSFKKKITL
jgi:hypothetical protein